MTTTCPLRPHVSGLFAFRSGTRGGAPGSDGVEMCAMVRIGSGASMEEQSPSVDIWGVFAFSGRHVPCSGNGASAPSQRHCRCSSGRSVPRKCERRSWSALVLSQLGFGNCLRKRLRLLPFFRSVDVGGWQPWDENGMWFGKGRTRPWND